MRQCPNENCNALVFIVLDPQKGLVEAFPPEVIDFDATDLPPNILETLEEAIRCHSYKAYKATALMVRRVLEELCEDKGATGNDLKARLQNLGGTITVPNELLDAADELRLLGNDAAHVKAKDYDAIGELEATAAVALAKELLKATYQYSSLVNKLSLSRSPKSPAEAGAIQT